MESIENIAFEDGGFITATGATRRGVQRRALSAAVEAGTLVRVDRGLYCLPETWEDEYVVAQHRYTRGVFSHDTALYLLGLSDQAPEKLTMTFPRGYNTTLARRFGVIAKSAPKDRFELGGTTAETPYGNEVAVYDAERTLCDMMRGAAEPDKQLLIPAMKGYLSSGKREIVKLQDCARALGVSGKMNAYLEVLL